MFMVSKLYMYIDQYNFFSKGMFNERYDEQKCCVVVSVLFQLFRRAWPFISGVHIITTFFPLADIL